MLFHVTATHTPEDCPAYNREKMPDIIAAMEKMEGAAKEANVKVHFFVNGAPEHVTFLLLEADSPSALARLTTSFPFRQDFKVTAVVRIQDTIAMAKQIASQQQRR